MIFRKKVDFERIGRVDLNAGRNSAGRCFDSAVPRKGAGDLDGE